MSDAENDWLGKGRVNGVVHYTYPLVDTSGGYYIHDHPKRLLCNSLEDFGARFVTVLPAVATPEPETTPVTCLACVSVRIAYDSFNPMDKPG